MPKSHLQKGLIVAVAGRRIDAPGAPVARFPPSAEATVLGRISMLLKERGASVVVAAAACGTDILALEAAGTLGICQRVVLPQGMRRFRANSVTDRPGGWGKRFDAVCRSARAEDDLRVHRTTGDPPRDWARGNLLILDEAQSLARSETNGDAVPTAILALIVWEGAPRGHDDMTAAFKVEAERRGLEVAEIRTQ